MEKGVCMLVTEQEGADIYIDRQSTGLKTPALVQVSIGKSMHVEFAKPGYKGHAVEIMSRNGASYYYAKLRPALRLIPSQVRAPQVEKWAMQS
jgi:hypothetical protein